eukprot:TRINITY_DN11743_c0_g3_i3.p2 TRINITY_DN11743_c0_g3~~TRINITY_DN11743_c0_g3_i3.p2  ORF type:complete len:122 (+),score=47.23 TRINITY_DN11743_c0_g3_i3:164-529(+)
MTMMRKLKKHEKKLLRKTDFLKYREETKSNEDKVIRNYYLQNREDYKKYNKLTGEVTSLVHHLRYLKPSSKVRLQVTQQVLDKLHSMGVIDQKGIAHCPHAATQQVVHPGCFKGSRFGERW